jgi:hypothetical protein
MVEGGKCIAHANRPGGHHESSYLTITSIALDATQISDKSCKLRAEDEKYTLCNLWVIDVRGFATNRNSSDNDRRVPSMRQCKRMDPPTPQSSHPPVRIEPESY